MSSLTHHCQVLGLSLPVHLEEVKTAYRRAALRYHPDRYHGNPEEGAQKFHEATEAFVALTEYLRITSKHPGEFHSIDPAEVAAEAFRRHPDDFRLDGVVRRRRQGRWQPETVMLVRACVLGFFVALGVLALLLYLNPEEAQEMSIDNARGWWNLLIAEAVYLAIWGVSVYVIYRAEKCLALRKVDRYENRADQPPV